MDIYVSAEEYDRLQAALDRPARPVEELPKLRALLAERSITP